LTGTGENSSADVTDGAQMKRRQRAGDNRQEAKTGYPQMKMMNADEDRRKETKSVRMSEIGPGISNLESPRPCLSAFIIFICG
jgi:hypothetical protein